MRIRLVAQDRLDSFGAPCSRWGIGDDAAVVAAAGHVPSDDAVAADGTAAGNCSCCSSNADSCYPSYSWAVSARKCSCAFCWCG